MVVRFISEWNVHQRLVRLKFLMKSMCGDELAREFISVLSVTLSVESHSLLGAMQDGASVNGAAIRVLTVMYPKLLDIRCLSHTLDLVGDRFKAPTLYDLMDFIICSQFQGQGTVERDDRSSNSLVMSSLFSSTIRMYLLPLILSCWIFSPTLSS